MSPVAGLAKELLLVEDNPGEALLIQEYLEGQEGATSRVVHVTSLAEAVTMLRSVSVDAVLLDLRLPDGSGVECVNAIRAHARDVPIVVLTGMDHEDLALECIAAGAQDYIPKQQARAYSLRRAIAYAITRVRELNERDRADALQQRLADIVEASSDAIVSCTTEGEILSWNGGAETIFGFTRAEAVGQAVGEVIRPLDESGRLEQQMLLVSVANDDGDKTVEIERRRKDGQAISLSVVTCRLRGSDGALAGVAAIYRDITEKKRREDELHRRNQELVARDRQMRALTARLNAVREDERIRISREVHDELGQLLTGLKMDLRWVERRLKADAGAALAVPLTGKVEEAERLVDGAIETIQRIATELRPSALDALGLPAAIRDEARRFEARTGVVSTVLVKDVSPPEPEAATALFRIFQEIVTNVARHARASALHIDLECGDSELVLRVRDDGVGFRPVQEAQPTSLGLLGMQERAAQLGGTCEVRTGVGQGTTVTARIPR